MGGAWLLFLPRGGGADPGSAIAGCTADLRRTAQTTATLERRETASATLERHRPAVAEFPDA